MNTMKRILLCTALLLLAGLCGRPARADGTYTPHVTLVSPPDNASYTIQLQSDGSYSAVIPISTTQFVDITGATPSRYVYVGWSIPILLTAYNSQGTPIAGTYVA